ncbi:8199_t:CDS:1, partial [Racocetra persica]
VLYLGGCVSLSGLCSPLHLTTQGDTGKELQSPDRSRITNQTR